MLAGCPMFTFNHNDISVSTVGHYCWHAGVKDILKNLSEKQGKKMNSSESAKDIPKFLELFKVRFMG
jgi:hypothetical protein